MKIFEWNLVAHQKEKKIIKYAPLLSDFSACFSHLTWLWITNFLAKENEQEKKKTNNENWYNNKKVIINNLPSLHICKDVILIETEEYFSFPSI